MLLGDASECGVAAGRFTGVFKKIPARCEI
jgi:hypothetical protein